LNIFFSNICYLYSSLKARDRLSKPYKPTALLYIETYIRCWVEFTEVSIYNVLNARYMSDPSNPTYG